MVYHTSQTASPDELRGRAEWTLDRVVHQGFEQLLASQEQYMADFWQRSDVQLKDSREDRTKRSTLEIQQAIRFNLFHILQASARAEDTVSRPRAHRTSLEALLLGHNLLLPF
jgi:alpha,alpha-trehalose phosphorylase